MQYNSGYDWLAGSHNTNCQIYACIIKGLDPSYEHTFYNTGGAENLLTQATKRVDFNEQTFSRLTKESVRVEADVMNFVDCNYLLIYNAPFAEGQKHIWMGAFITKVEWVSVYVADIYFKIDPIQTFLFQFANLGECFVEREQAPIDEKIGDFLLPEPLGDMPIITAETYSTHLFDNYRYVLITTCEQTNAPSTNYVEAKTITGISFIGDLRFYSSIQNMKTAVDFFAQAGLLESIATAYMYPETFCTVSEEPISRNFTVTPPTDFNGYQPKYNKLFTYPYSFLEVDSGDMKNNFKYELFGGTSIVFTLYGVMGAQPLVSCIPLSYDSQTNNQDIVTIMSSFPYIMYSGNAFANWWGQHASSFTVTSMGNAAMLAGGVMTGNPTLAIGGGAGVVRNFSELLTSANLPDVMRMNGNTVYNNVATRKQDFYFRCKQVNKEAAETIDHFFDVYGYSVMKLKKPVCDPTQTKGGTHCYVKLGNVSFAGDPTGGIADYLAEIVAILQKGITFWSLGSEIGNYG